MLELSPEDASHEQYYKPVIVSKLGIAAERIRHIQIIRKSVDARRRKVRVNMAFRVFLDELPGTDKAWQPALNNVEKSRGSGFQI